ncbi:Uncharacterised protein [uncultured archaeon]|nr:Uncharacterised protein [uncultured archaeon]
MGNDQPQNQNGDDEYGFKVDAQVEKFLDFKQQLTYFLITGSAAIIAFLVDFTIKYRNEVGNLVWFVIISSIAGLLTSAFSLLNIYFGLESHSRHLDYRYKRKHSLTDNEQKEWTCITSLAHNFLKLALISLSVEIALAMVFFILFFI